jgi:hypothetical protein
VLQGGLIDEAIAGLCPCARDLRRSPGAGALHQTLRAVAGKAVAPLAQGRIGKVQRVGARLEALPGDDGTHGLGPAEDPGLFRLL